MNHYEIMYIVKPTVEDDERARLADTLKATIEKDGGTVDKVTEWGLRDFAYEIQHFKRGYYTIWDITGSSAAVAEFNRIARINANVLRHMIIRK